MGNLDTKIEGNFKMGNLDTKIEVTENPVKDRIIDYLAFNNADLNKLNANQIEHIGMLVRQDEFKENLKKEVELRKYDETDIKEFIDRYDSAETRKRYLYSLMQLKNWSEKNNMKYFALEFDEADKFVKSLMKDGKSNLTALGIISACSNFYNWKIERKNSRFRNPFGRTLWKPKRMNKREIFVPSQQEIDYILSIMSPLDQAAILMCVLTGLRRGALHTLCLKDNGNYSYRSKGKYYPKIQLPYKVKQILGENGFSVERPFEDFNPNNSNSMLNYRLKKAVKEGKVRHVYSFHDFRHFFAIKHYKENKDIYGLQKILGHSSIATTEAYLKGVGVLED
jgi:integrase